MVDNNLQISPCVLVTGANGFLGSEIVRQAIFTQIQVCATDKDSAAIVPNVDFRSADILDHRTLNPLFRDVSTVIHAAGLAHVFDKTKASNVPFQAVNEFGTANVARAAGEAGVRHFVLVSSVSVYGPFTQGLFDENTPCNPKGPYAESKCQAEQRAKEIAKQAGMALTILRLATLYGEGDPGNVARLMRSIDKGYFVWIGKGKNRKSLLYKGDAARTCLAVATRPTAGINIYNVSSPPCIIRDIVEGLARALKKKPPPVRIPVPVAVCASRLISLLPNERLAQLYLNVQKWLAEEMYDTKKIENTYEFEPKVSLSEGLKREVNWYKHKQLKWTLRTEQEVR